MAATEKVAIQTTTSTSIFVQTASVAAPCCVCPRPRPKPAGLPKKKVPLLSVTLPSRDPTAETAAYLKEQMKQLADCAPQGGAPLRIHLEVKVSPPGPVEQVRLTNVEPLPSEVAACVERTVKGLTPPPFDGSAAETFALTVLL